MIFLLSLLSVLSSLFVVNGHVSDKTTGEPLPSAAVVLSSEGKTVKWAVSDSEGNYSLKDVPEGNYTISVSYVSYKTFRTSIVVTKDLNYDMLLSPDENALKEVVVTAVEHHGLTSATTIREDAIAHIQPSSFADLLELLPGGIAKDPVLGSPQLINLRAANELTNSDYATSALGTKFMIDGRPVNNDANLQQSVGYSSLGSSYVNYGTDMREITTEDIESVNIVRGIASVKYGDLTSGLIDIKRKKGGNDIHARFKSDMKSKLLYAGKGFEWVDGQDKTTLNASVNYLDSKADPRDLRQNWTRLTGSLRAARNWNEGDYEKSLSASFDYTRSLEDEKSDADLDISEGGGPIETYKSVYNKMAFGSEFSLRSKDHETFFRSLDADFSLSYENDLIDRWKRVSLGKSTPISIATEAGESDAVIVPANYDATQKVEGKPFYTYASISADFAKGIHKIQTGLQWTMDKNYGGGTIYDTSRPFSTGISVRPRAYSEIPSTHQFSAFAQEDLIKILGNFKIEWMAGLRMEMLAGAGKKYEINMKPYLDPRTNLRVNLPSMVLKDYKMDIGIYCGAGLHTKFPTMDMLYPDPLYGDITQMNYWPVEENLRRVNLLVYKIDPTNYNLKAARNLKWEIGFDTQWNGFSFSADFFVEDMHSGFRYGYEYTSITAKKYDTSGIVKKDLTGPPSLENLPYRNDTTLNAYSYNTNGSRTLKKGVEFTFQTKRFKAIGTRITASGAWFKTEYMNSVPEYYRPSLLIGGEIYPYIGLYDHNDGSMYDSMTSNIMADTQIPSLGLIFSTSIQCQWYTGYQTKEDSKYPVSYIDKSLSVHDFTTEDQSDAILSHLVRDYTASLYQYQRVPFAMNVNLKISKKLYHDKASVSVYVNRIFDVTPNYKRNGVIVRRNVTPYFGMELDFKI